MAACFRERQTASRSKAQPAPPAHSPPAPPADHNRSHSTSGGHIGGQTSPPTPARAGSTGTRTGGGNYAGRRRRLAGSPRRRVLRARYQVYTQSIYDPPYSPPKAHARGKRHSCKIYSHSPPQEAGQREARQAGQHSNTSARQQAAEHQPASASSQKTTSTSAPPDRPAERPAGNKTTRLRPIPDNRARACESNRARVRESRRARARRYSRRHPQSLRVRRRKIFLGVYRKFSLPLVRAEKKKGGPKNRGQQGAGKIFLKSEQL